MHCKTRHFRRGFSKGNLKFKFLMFYAELKIMTGLCSKLDLAEFSALKKFLFELSIKVTVSSAWTKFWQSLSDRCPRITRSSSAQRELGGTCGSPTTWFCGECSIFFLIRPIARGYKLYKLFVGFVQRYSKSVKIAI